NEYSPANSDTNIWATFISTYTSTPPVDNDWYSVNTNAGDNLVISVNGFNSNESGLFPGEFENNVDAAVQLYDSMGNLVGSGVEQRDGSEQITFPSAGGTYFIRVFAESGQGEYVLSAQGATGELPAFVVTSTDPAAGAIVPPTTELTVTFNHEIFSP